MKADELLQQYDAGTITARELVEGVWEKVENNRGTRRHPTPFFNGERRISWEHRFAEWDEGWKDAAEFTRERIEEIKKARRDTQSVEDWDADRKGWIALLGMGHEEPEYIASISRILTLVRAHLDTLCVGIKPEALK
jgi:hypothetical protein